MEDVDHGKAMADFVAALAGDHDDLGARIRKVSHTAKSDSAGVNIHAHFLAFRNGLPTLHEFVEILSAKLIGFCLPRKHIRDAQAGWADLSPMKQLEKAVHLQNKAIDLFKRANKSSNRNGEFGEVITYLLIESILHAPQFIAKMSLKTNSQMPVHGSDGIHLSYDAATKQLKLYWGEPQERVRELAAHEQEALINAMRDDYLPWFEFLQLTARRLNETLIKWSDVDWSANEILTIGKGDRRVWTPMSASVRTILESCKGQHPTYVFTYTAQRTRDGRIKGQRYPITHGGVSAIWKRVVRKAGVQDFRLHDNRHDTASKVLRKTGNLKVVSRLLNHTNIATTSKYAHVLDEEVAEALERNAESRNKSRINRALPPASPAE